MKIRNFTLSILMLFLGTFVVQAQYYNRNARVVAQNYDISDNLDLQAVASIFGESRNLEDFERRLNDPSLQISNLDLNNDQYVDYLRVIEVADNDARIIVIQAVLGQDMFQDVATIELERRNTRNSLSPTVYVQVVGNPYLYGPNYIYEPYYWYRPVFFDLMWGPHYTLYYSPWYWGYYPAYYSYWRPMPVFRYRRHITPVINTRNRYVYSSNRNIRSARNIYSSVSRNSYADRNPGRSFTNRNRQVTNRYELVNTRDSRTREIGRVDRNNTSNSVDRAVDRYTDRSVRSNNSRSYDSRSVSDGVINRSSTDRQVGTRSGSTNRSNVRSYNTSRTRIERSPSYNSSSTTRSYNSNRSYNSSRSTSPSRSVSTSRSTSFDRGSSSRSTSSSSRSVSSGRSISR